MEQTPFGEILLNDLKQWADFWNGRLQRAVEEMAACPAVETAYGAGFLAMSRTMEALREATDRGWDAVAAVDLAFPRLKPVRGQENEYWKTRMQKLKERFQKELKEVMEPFVVTQAEHLEDLRAMAPAMLALVDLTADFTESFQQEKVRRNVADFSDQEHYAGSAYGAGEADFLGICGDHGG